MYESKSKANEIDRYGENGLLRAISSFIGKLNCVYFEDLDYLYSDEYYGDVKNVLELVEITEDINVKNRFGETALLKVLWEWVGHLNVCRNDADDDMRRIAVAILNRDPDVTEETVEAIKKLKEYGAYIPRSWLP